MHGVKIENSFQLIEIRRKESVERTQNAKGSKQNRNSTANIRKKTKQPRNSAANIRKKTKQPRNSTAKIRE